MYYEQLITKHHAGFGMWQAGAANGDGWEEEQDLVEEITQNTYSLIELGQGDQEAEEEIEDIRGHIYNEPPRVFAFRRSEDADIEYLGIIERP